jgi:F0F1-type ATP synthase assembly protein I
MRFNYNKHRGWIEHLSILMQIGLTMAGCIVFCFYVGFYLDRWIGTKGVFVAVFILLGVIGGAVTVYRQIREVLEPKAKNRTQEEDD